MTAYQIGHSMEQALPARKPLVWLHGEIRTPPFSKTARVEAGTLLRRLQEGELLSLPHSRPMPSIGPRCHELRIVDEGQNWRIVYRLDDAAVIVADIFAKTTSRTPKPVIDACQRRLKRYDRCGGRETESELTMDKAVRRSLETAGFRIGNAEDFLELTPEERELVTLRLAVSRAVRRLREERQLTQKQLAAIIQSSQSRVAKLEAGSADVSLDLLFRGLFAVGGTLADLPIRPRKRRAATAGRRSAATVR